ncbi:MAG: peptidylprolyl isomerase [Micavibrio sp.]|nr:peptidylprolyl isomerase [Micavibrio sp.]
MSLRAHVIRLTAAAVIATAMLSHPLQPAFSADDTVVAIVNGDKIYKKDVMNALKQLPVKPEDAPKAFPLVLDQVVSEKLIDEASQAAKIEDTPEYKKQLDAVKAQLVKQIYFEKVLSSKVTDAMVKAEYNRFKDQNKGKMEVHARHILVPTKEEAEKVIKDLDGGAKFEDLAKQRSSGPAAQNGGDLGSYMVKEEFIDPDMGAKVVALKAGTYSKEPIKSQFGWHVFKVDDKRERKVPDFDKSVDDAIRQKLSQVAVADLVKSLKAKADIKTFDMDGKPVVETGNAAQQLEQKEASDKKPAKADKKAPKADKAADDKASDDKDDADDSDKKAE